MLSDPRLNRRLQANETREYRWFFYGFYMLIFFALSVQYKVDNEEAVRPLYVYGLLMVGLIWIASSIRSKLPSTLYRAWSGPGAIMIVVLLFYLYIHSMFAGERQFKDSLYLSCWLLLIAPLFLLSVKRSGGVYSILVLSRSVIYFSIISSIVSILVFVGILQFEVGNYTLIQNYWTAFRLHGYLGQPSAFGALVGFSLILLSYLSKLHKVRYLSLTYLFLILVLLGSGSRAAIVALIASYVAALVVEHRRLSGAFVAKVMLVQFSLILSFLILTLFDYVPSSLFISIDRNDFEPESENNRLLIWSNVVSLISVRESFFSIFFGEGAGELVSIYRAAFNVPLQIIYDYGVIGVVIYLGSVVVSIYVGIRRFVISRCIVYKLGLMLLVYGFVFNLFISSFLSPFFNFQTFALILGVVVVNLPISFFSDLVANEPRT